MRRLLFENVLGGAELQPVSPSNVESPDHETSSQPLPSDGFVTHNKWICKPDKENKIVEIWMFGVLQATNHYLKIISLLHDLDADYVVHLYIHGPGGSISVGCNLISAMHRCKATIITHNLGTAASCASLILSFGDKIAIYPNAITMFHNAGFGNFESVHRMRSQAKHAIASTTMMLERMRDRGIITADEVDGIVKRGEEYFITSDVMIGRLKEAGILYTGGE